MAIHLPTSYNYVYLYSACVCVDLSGVGTELTKVSDEVQRIKGSVQLCLFGTTLLPQLSLS